MLNFYIYLAVIVSGAAVLAIELLGTRIIAPFYGTSIYLWSALISVTLAALSVGYAVGGRLADRGARLNQFCVIIALAGLWIGLIPWISSPVLAATEETMGLRTAVLVTATILFFPPLALLGMISPYAIKMKASSLDVVGRTAGNLYAVSTVASVVAAIATGFFLIPYVGVHRLVFLVGLVLVTTALIGLVSRRKIQGTVAVALIVVIAVITAFKVSPAQAADAQAGLLAVEQSAYADLRVVDKDDVRYLLIDGGSHTVVDLETGASHLAYTNVFDIAKMFSPAPGKALLVGLGGGATVRSFVQDGWHVDAVEIDPVVTSMARKYFWLRDSNLHVYEMDGRQFLQSNEDHYDVVLMDAFGSSYVPFHLVTEEAFGLVRSRLSPSGVVAINIETIGWHDVIVQSLAATLKSQFKHVLALPIAEPPDQLGNLVLMASDRELVLEKEPPVPNYRFSAEYDRAHAWDNRFEVNTEGAQVLTDDLNPIDVWSERVNFEARKQLHATLDKRGIAW